MRELQRELSDHVLKSYEKELELYWKVLNQKRSDKDNIYSLHKPFTTCIAKGKAHKQYEPACAPTQKLWRKRPAKAGSATRQD